MIGDEFNERGYVILRGIFSEANVGQIAETLRAALGQPGDAADQDLASRVLVREDEDHSKVYQAAISVGSSAAAYRLIGSSEVLERVNEAVGVPFTHLHCMPLHIAVQIPKVGDFDYQWHQESTFYPWCRDVISVWFPVSGPSSAATGTMTVIPGSHRDGELPYERYYTNEKFLQLHTKVSAEEAATAVPIEINVGDAVLFSSDLVHASIPNRSGAPRVTGILRLVNMTTQSTYRPLYKALSYEK